MIDKFYLHEQCPFCGFCHQWETRLLKGRDFPVIICQGHIMWLARTEAEKEEITRLWNRRFVEVKR